MRITNLTEEAYHKRPAAKPRATKNTEDAGVIPPKKALLLRPYRKKNETIININIATFFLSGPWCNARRIGASGRHSPQKNKMAPINPVLTNTCRKMLCAV